MAKSDAAERFHEALSEALRQVEDPAKRDEAFTLLSECNKVPAETLAKQPQNANEPVVDMTVLNAMAKQMVELKLLPQQPDLEPFVPQFARS